MNDENKERTFNDEQRTVFEQPEDAPSKTRPRTPGERNTPSPDQDDAGGEGSSASSS
jgi:hypothetical protein